MSRIMRPLLLPSLFVLAVACGDCGETAGKTNNDDNSADAANNGGDAGNNGGGDAGNNGGGDAGNNGGGDAGNNGQLDMGGMDTGGGDAGGDAGGDTGGMDAGPDATQAVCGNMEVETGEDCDDGNMDSDDMCNNDCTFTCGDGVVGTNETCDTAIGAGMMGACPTACDDMDACTTNTLQGSECTAECVFGAITACTNADGCCPSTCNATNDDDCMPMCGNGVVEGTEVCDGNCPAGCDDSVACTADSAAGSAVTCDLVCSNVAITACVDGDGCCPATCTTANDDDCSATCGDGVVDMGETCDMNCPTSCDDADSCTADSMTGTAGQCNVVCTNAPITMCVAGDGCCPTGCTSANDADCTAVCGNGNVEAGEECDDGGTAPGDGCDANCQDEPIAFRLSDLDIRDPHIYAVLPFFGCEDITDSVPLNLSDSVNDLLENAIQCDGDCGSAGDDDGLLDVSFVLLFDPLDQANGGTGSVTVLEADCTAPMSSTTCSPSAGGLSQSGTYSTDTANTCLDVLPNTTRPYSPAITTPAPACFATDSISLTIDFSGISIPLEAVEAGATYVGNPATDLSNGLLRGFLSEAAADAIVIPDTIAVVGGRPLSSLLPGGDPPASGTACNGNADCMNGERCVSGACSYENCAGHSDLDVGPDGTTPGWWFYFNFPADRVPYTP